MTFVVILSIGSYVVVGLFVGRFVVVAARWGGSSEGDDGQKNDGDLHDDMKTSNQTAAIERKLVE